MDEIREFITITIYNEEKYQHNSKIGNDVQNSVTTELCGLPFGTLCMKLSFFTSRILGCKKNQKTFIIYTQLHSINTSLGISEKDRSQYLLSAEVSRIITVIIIKIKIITA